MRTTLAALSFAAGVGLVWCQSAGALPADGTAIKEVATATSSVEQTQFYMRRTRHGIRKCYRDFIIGPYVCHTFWTLW